MDQFTLTTEFARELAVDLTGLATTPGVRCVLIVDRAGRMMASAGDLLDTDVIALASLAAADFNANEQLARLVGERGFRTLVHRGENSSVHVEDAGGKAVVITLYGSTAPPGLVRELAREAAQLVTETFDRMAERNRTQSSSTAPPLAGAEDEIDRLFDW